MTSRAGDSEARTQPVLELVGGLQPTEAEGAEAVGVADPDQPVGVEQDEGEGALQPREDREEGPLRGRSPSSARLPPRAVGREGLRASSSATRSLSEATRPGSMPAASASGGGVGQVAVVGQAEPGPPHAPVDRLGVAPVARDPAVE